MWCTEQFEIHLTRESGVWLSKCAENILHDRQWFHPPFCWHFYISFYFQRGDSNIMPPKMEKKRHELFAKAKQRHHDRSVLPLRLTGCTFQKPVTKITSHPGDVVRHRWCEGTLGEAAASLCIQEAAAAPGLQPWRRAFQDLGQHKGFMGYCSGARCRLSSWVVLVPDLCTPALSPSLLVYR